MDRRPISNGEYYLLPAVDANRQIIPGCVPAYKLELMRGYLQVFVRREDDDPYWRYFSPEEIQCLPREVFREVYGISETYYAILLERARSIEYWRDWILQLLALAKQE